MSKKILKLKKITKSESYNGKGMVVVDKIDNILMFLTAIPGIGSIIILFYYLCRKVEEFYVEVKEDE